MADEPRREEPAVDAAEQPADAAAPEGGRSRVRAVAATVLTVLAALLVWFALVAPTQLSRLNPTAFVTIPVEGLAILALVLTLRHRAQRTVAVLVGLVLALVTVLKVLDMGFFEALGRPFNPVFDRGYFGSAEGLLSDSVGAHAAVILLIALGLALVALFVLMPLAVLRLTRLVDRHRAASIRTGTALAVVWGLCAVLGVQFVSHTPVADTSAVSLAYHQVNQVRTSLQDERDFKQELGVDPVSNTSGQNLLTGLRGKDVVVAFVESYGRVAVQGSFFSPGVDAVLDAGTRQLQAAGFSSQSAFLTSPTFGGISWLAHSTLQSGLWVNNQLRYNDLVKTDRFTLSDAFKRAGWRTFDDVPSNTKNWTPGKTFYHYDKIYDSRNVGYKGPKFSYAAMPDQFTLSALQRNELGRPGHAPVFGEIDLVSSHTPWAPLPRMVDWNDVGDGSIFDGMPAQGQSPKQVWRVRSQVQAAYGQSIEYSLTSLISFVQHFHDKNLVLIVLGDHQPNTTVSGDGPNRDVPISIIAHDPAVMDQISGWGWQPGLRPSPNAVVWPMDAFRDRFLAAYGSQPRMEPAPIAKH